MIVISDTTPIISLLKANHLELLEKLYGNVLIPEAVYQELISNPAYEKEMLQGLISERVKRLFCMTSRRQICC